MMMMMIDSQIHCIFRYHILKSLQTHETQEQTKELVRSG